MQRRSAVNLDDEWLLVVLVFWGFQLHLFDIVATVQFSMREYRLAWLHPGGSGLSYFQSNVAIAALLLVLGLLYAVRAWRAESSFRAIVVPASFVLFVSLFSYRLVFLNSHSLNNEWYTEATRDEPWDARRHHLGFVLEWPAGEVATVVLEDQSKLALPLPAEGDRSRVVGVVEYRARYSGRVRYEATYFVPYDDLELFLSRYTSFETPR